MTYGDRQRLMRDTLVVILDPVGWHRQLTGDTAGALPFAGPYRLIDLALSNCCHAGLKRVCVVPWVESRLLVWLRRRWRDRFSGPGEFLRVVSAERRPGAQRGTAQALVLARRLLERESCPWTVVVVLDHAGRIDYGRLVLQHVESAVDVTAVCRPPGWNRASRPCVPAEAPGTLVALGRRRALREAAGRRLRLLDCAGVYVFDTEALLDVVGEESCAQEHSIGDFGADVVQRLAQAGGVVRAHDLGRDANGAPLYWRGLGGVADYWSANMELLSLDPPFLPEDPRWRVLGTGAAECVRLVQGTGATSQIADSLVCPGATVRGARVERSILYPRAYVDHGAQVAESVVLDGAVVGPGARLRRAVVGEGVVIPAGYAADPPAGPGAEPVVIARGAGLAFDDRPLEEAARRALMAGDGGAAAGPVMANPPSFSRA